MIITGLDIETTGLEQSQGHRIIEIGAILVEYKGPNVPMVGKGKWVQRINPQRPIDPAAQAVHGISFEELSNEPTWDEVAPSLVKILKSTKLVITHNGDSFDMPFIFNELIRLGISPVSLPSVDTCKQAGWATPNGKLPKLQELCFACGVDYDKTKAHAALYDVQVTLDCFFVGYSKGFFQIPESLKGELTNA